MPPVNTNETLELVKNAQGSPDEALAKSITQATGLVAYDLRGPALSLIPVLTPIRNRLPRVGGQGGTAIHWKGITGINTTNVGAGVSEGKRGGLVTTSTADYLATYKGIGLEDDVTFEAEYAGVNFQDVKATAALNLLRATMIAEERILLAGNTSLALGTTPTPTLTASASGGTLATAAAFSVICVALTPAGYRRASVAAGVTASITRTNADATTDTFGGGAAQKSANATVSVTGATGSVSATVTPVAGAVAYAWYAGATATSEKLVAITTINSVLITALNGSGQLASALPSADNSTDSLVFDGMLTFAFNSANGGYQADLATGTAGTGTGLTSDSAAGIAEFTTAFRYFWDNYRMSPERILVSAQEQANINKKIIANGGAPLLRVTESASQGHLSITGGVNVSRILNPITGTMVDIELHPDMPPGVVLFEADTVPYPLSGVTNVKEVVTRRDYYQLEWPLVTRKYQYGVYADEVLRVKVPFTLGMIKNIANV